MKLQFRHQSFQADAANAACDIFAGQSFRAPIYMVDSGLGEKLLTHAEDFIGFSNAPVAVADDKVLEHIRAVQRGGGV